MDNRNEIREFLTTRRARITPEQAGLPAYGGHRRVAGLRREEVALLAGVSVDYYTRLEKGNLTGVSDTVLEASPARSSSTRPSGCTCSISPAQPTPAPPVPPGGRYRGNCGHRPGSSSTA